jgi:hypothetical protein
VNGEIRTLVRRPPPRAWDCQTTWLKITWAKVGEKMTRRKKGENFIWEPEVDFEDDTVLLL